MIYVSGPGNDYLYSWAPQFDKCCLWYAAPSPGMWAGKINLNWKQNDKDLLLLPVLSLLVISQYQVAVAGRKLFVWRWYLLIVTHWFIFLSTLRLTDCGHLISGAPVLVQAAGRVGEGGDGGRDQHPAHSDQQRGEGPQEHLPRSQGVQTSLGQTKSCVREQGEIERALVNIQYKQRKSTIRGATSTERWSASALWLMITLTPVPASLQHCSITA